MVFRLSSTSLRKHVMDLLARRLLLCMLLAGFLVVGAPIAIAIVVAAVSPTPAPDAIAPPL